MQSWWSRNVAGARAVFVSMTHYTNCLTELDPSKRRKEIHTHTHKPHRTTPHTYPSWEATHRQWWISKTQINCLGIQLKCSLLLKAWGVWTGRHSASQSCWERRMSPRAKGAHPSLEKVQARHWNKSCAIKKWLILNKTGMLLRILERLKSFQDVENWDV